MPSLKSVGPEFDEALLFERVVIRVISPSLLTMMIDSSPFLRVLTKFSPEKDLGVNAPVLDLVTTPPLGVSPEK